MARARARQVAVDARDASLVQQIAAAGCNSS